VSTEAVPGLRGQGDRLIRPHRRGPGRRRAELGHLHAVAQSDHRGCAWRSFSKTTVVALPLRPGCLDRLARRWRRARSTSADRRHRGRDRGGPVLAQWSCTPVSPRHRCAPSSRARASPPRRGRRSPGRDPRDGVITRIAASTAAPAQVCWRWHIELGNIVIPKSWTSERSRRTSRSSDFELGADEIDAITPPSARPQALDLRT